MAYSDNEHSRSSSPIPWTEMFQTASSPSSPHGLTASRSSPALGYVSQALQFNQPPNREAKKPPRPTRKESIPRKSVAIQNGKGTISDPSVTAEAPEKPSLREETSDNISDRASSPLHPNGQADVGSYFSQQNFQLAVYIAMAHAVLIFLVLVLYGIWKLLECYRSPIQWAVLCSMPLRAIHGTVVAFWEQSLNQGLLGTVLAIPFAICKALIRTTLDARLTILHIFGKSRSKHGRTVRFSTLVEWLVSFAVLTLAYESMGVISFAFVPFVVIVLYSLGTVLGLVPVMEDLEMEDKHSILSSEPSARWKEAQSWLGWVFSPLTKAYKLLGARLTSVVLDNLHHLVAVCLMVLLIVGSLSGLVLFSYKIGSEGKGAVVALKSHVQRSNYVEKLGLKQWLEENKVPELIDTYASKAYDTVSDQIDVFAAKYQMTELADVGKQYLIGFAQGQRKGHLGNSSELFTQPILSHPVLHRVHNITQRFRDYDIRGAYSELHQGILLALEHFNIPREELFEKAKQAGERWLGVGQHVFTNSSRLLSRFMKLLIFSAGTILSGAPEFIGFCADSFVFFSVLHYLVVSKSGGVMDQVLSMLPLSESTRTRCAIVLDHAVSSVLLAAVKAAFFQASFTWLLFHVLKIHFLFMSTLLAFLSALLPIIPTWWSSIPAVAQLVIEGHYIRAVLLVVVHIGFMDYGVSAIQSGIPGHNAYMTGLSIAGGMAVFSSAIEGAIMGPLLMTVAISLKNLYTEFVLNNAKRKL